MSASVTLQEAAEFLKANDHYLILTHRRPDGDTVGSCAALCRALRALGKQAWVYPNPQFTPKYAPFLDGLLAHDLAAGSRQQATDTPAAAHSVRHAVPRSDESPVTSHQPPADDPQAVDQFSILNSRLSPVISRPRISFPSVRRTSRPIWPSTTTAPTTALPPGPIRTSPRPPAANY